MTKIEAQTIINANEAENKKIQAYNDLQNEGGDGYEVDHNFDGFEAVKAAGYAVYEGKVFDRADFEALREKWNGACIALKGQKVNIDMIANKSGVNAMMLQCLKTAFV